MNTRALSTLATVTTTCFHAHTLPSWGESVGVEHRLYGDCVQFTLQQEGKGQDPCLRTTRMTLKWEGMGLGTGGQKRAGHRHNRTSLSAVQPRDAYLPSAFTSAPPPPH